jgi:hypothetical protein
MIQNFVAYNPHHVKRLAGRYRIDNDIPVYSDKVLRIKYAVFILGWSH